jgi:hypothetical protein
MESQKKTLNVLIAKEIEGLYRFAGHEITKDQVIEMAYLIEKKYSQIDENKFVWFIESCKAGEYGAIQKNPTFLMGIIKDNFRLVMP